MNEEHFIIEAERLNLSNKKGEFIDAAKHILIESESIRHSSWPNSWPLPIWARWCYMPLLDRLALAELFIKMAITRFDEIENNKK